MKTYQTIPAILLLLTAFSGFSQKQDIRIGSWKSYLPYTNGRSVTQSSDKVYFSTDLSVVAVDKEDNATSYYDKINSLSDIGVQFVRYNQKEKVLLVVYKNSNIDLLRDDGTVNLGNIKTNQQILGDKRIYGVFFQDSLAYLACGFGVVQLNLHREEFGFTTFTRKKINAVAVYNGYLYAGTDTEIYRVALNNVNIADFGNWELFRNEGCNAMAVKNNLLYFTGGNLFTVLYTYDGTGLKFAFSNGDGIRFLSAEGKFVLIGYFFEAYTLDASYQTKKIQGSCIGKYSQAVEDEQGWFWIGDDYSGFVKTDGKTACTVLSFNAPSLSQTGEILYDNGTLWCTAGGVLDNTSPQYNGAGFTYLKDGVWKSQSFANNAFMKNNELFDFYRVAVQPKTQKVYFGTVTRGLVEFDPATNNLKVYGDTNSSLQKIPGDNTVRITGMAFDKDGNLWISNFGAPSPISVLKKDGTWRSFSGAATTYLWQMTVDDYGYKWIAGLDRGLIIYDSGKNIDDPADDRYRLIDKVNTQNGLVDLDRVGTVVKDLDGDIWIGTSKGAVVFECGSNPFDEKLCRGAKRIVVQDGFPAYLLETEDVRTIAVDGANRKWFGTTNGVFVQSADGEEQIAWFTPSNSPLFDKNITDIAIDNASGEVFISTAQGLLSYRGEAIAGDDYNEPDAYAFPNPVRPGYDGPIAIKGLARDANVKITDISGQVVFEGRSLGGQAIWNGRDLTGRKVASGVYLVFSTSTRNINNPNAIVTKIVFIN